MPIAVPLASALISGIGAYSASRKRKKSEAALEAEVAKQKPNESILDYYNKAYSKYSPNAYQSAEYNQQMRSVLGNQATGINALQNRRSALAGLPSIVQGTNVAAGRAAAGAEATQRANLGMLGQSAGAKAGEENRIKQMRLNLMAQKAAAQAQTQNALTQGAFNSLSNAAALSYGIGKEGNYGFGNIFGKGGG